MAVFLSPIQNYDRNYSLYALSVPCPSIDSLFTAKVESENGTTSDMMEAFVSLEVRIAPGILHYMHAFPKVIDNDN
jgi:hypothetical protein